MIVKYPERSEAVSEKGTRHPNEELGGANIFPDKQESVQTYPREAGSEHPDEARPEYAPKEGQWPIKGNVKEYPRHAD
jgi:hypothetical protein